jgi:hypothetical protein
VALAPDTVVLTCPVCGNTEEALGAGVGFNTYFANGELITTLSFNASVQHDCPGITGPTP